MKIYLAIKSIKNSFGFQILGAYYQLNEAKNKCLAEPALTKLGWNNSDYDYEWHNGAGLLVSVKEIEVT